MSRSLLAALSLVACLVGCAATDPDPGGGDGPDAGAGGDCVPDSCGAADCGQVPDGCGGILSCGPCGGGDCIPATCEPGMCGEMLDGCGGPLNCGDPCGAADCVSNMCACAADPAEPNDSTAKHLANFSDCGDPQAQISDLSLGGNDVDRFTLGVADDAFCGTNPQTGIAIDARNSTTAFKVKIQYACNGTLASVTCGNSTLEGTDSCVGTVAPGTSGAFITLTPNCSGGDEDGTSTITVENVAGACEPYDMVYRLI